MITVFHARLYGRFTEIQNNLRSGERNFKKSRLIFLGNSYNRNNVNALIQFRRKVSSSILKDDISSRTDTSIFTLIAPMLLDQSNETSLVLPALKATSHLLPQSTVSEVKVSILVVVTEQMSDHT